MTKQDCIDYENKYLKWLNELTEKLGKLGIKGNVVNLLKTITDNTYQYYDAGNSVEDFISKYITPNESYETFVIEKNSLSSWKSDRNHTTNGKILLMALNSITYENMFIVINELGKLGFRLVQVLSDEKFIVERKEIL